MPRILNAAQAKAVYDAICCMNNVSGYLFSCRMPRGITVHEKGDTIIVNQRDGIWRSESYESWLQFAQTYEIPD